MERADREKFIEGNMWLLKRNISSLTTIAEKIQID